MKCFLTLVFLFFCTGMGISQEKNKGPVIKGFGEVWDIPKPTYGTNTSGEFMAVFDVMNSPEDPNQLNPWIETAARFLNMHARAGVPTNQLQAGVQVLFCGQSSMARQVPIEKTVKGVQLSLSAMTALIQLQESGYHLIKF